MEDAGAKLVKICIFSPYIPKHTGGGERYLFDVAIALKNKHHVSFAIPADQFTSSKSIQKKYEAFLGEELSTVAFIPTPLGTKASFITKLLWTKNWDVLYYATDGSLFFSLAKRNVLHIQFPFNQKKHSIVDRLKLHNWSIKNTNSTFTKNIVEPSWPVKIDEVHHPQIKQALTDDQLIKALPKKGKIILHVGRFFRQLHCKKQVELVSFFQDLERNHPKQAKGWKLVMIGSVEDQSYADEVTSKISSKNIHVIHDVTRPQLLEWYQKASIYWHATGYGIDQDQFPTKVEHFGISTGEAMSYGCVPIVIDKGGQPEVVGDKLKHLLWNSKQECVDITMSLISNPKQLLLNQLAAHTSIQRFSPKVFTDKLTTMIGEK